MLTSSRRIHSAWSRLLYSSHSSLYRSISSLVCLIFFLRTSNKDPCCILVVISYRFFIKNFTINHSPIPRTRPTSNNWASRQDGADSRLPTTCLKKHQQCEFDQPKIDYLSFPMGKHDKKNGNGCGCTKFGHLTSFTYTVLNAIELIRSWNELLCKRCKSFNGVNR